MKEHVEIDHLTKYDAFKVSKHQVMDLDVSNFWDSVLQNHINSLKFFMISVILFKTGKHSDFYISFF